MNPTSMAEQVYGFLKEGRGFNFTSRGLVEEERTWDNFKLEKIEIIVRDVVELEFTFTDKTVLIFENEGYGSSVQKDLELPETQRLRTFLILQPLHTSITIFGFHFIKDVWFDQNAISVHFLDQSKMDFFYNFESHQLRLPVWVLSDSII